MIPQRVADGALRVNLLAHQQLLKRPNEQRAFHPISL